MTREQLDALEALLAKATTRPWELIRALRNNAADLIALAHEALELREALEFAAGEMCSLYKAGGGRYCAVLFEGGASSEQTFFGATPLEAIQNTRRGK